MNKIIVGVLGFFAGLLVCAIGAYCVILSGTIPARQDLPSSGLETWAAHQSLRATIQRESAQLKCPLQADEESLKAGAKVYGENCSGCHGAPAAPTPAFAAAYSPSAPLFANGDTVTDDPESKIYWIVDHGIKFTGMPSFNKMLSEKQMWQVLLF